MGLSINLKFATVKDYSDEIQKMLNQPEALPLSKSIYVELHSIIKMLSNSVLEDHFISKVLKNRMTLLIQRVKLSYEKPNEVCALLCKVNKAAIFYLLNND